ncbi:MAG: T9SS type A sorting domain-containing protein [FCB group bacterium]|nr:T9SS type A sorting domain-containing protein [FCB group bacterium]MBL7120399.1 T9SS type A sorting domain-containing protein [Candidatus Neomarinimicrobiota bacterium]
MLKKLLVLTILSLSFGFAQWVEVVIEPLGKMNQIQVLDDGLAYVALGGTGHSGALKTTDYGATWDTLNYYAGEGASSFLTVAFNSAGVGFVAGPIGYMEVSLDGGETWSSDISPGGPNKINKVQWVTETRFVAADFKGILYYTEDNGATWTEDYALNTALLGVHGSANITALEIVDENNWLACGKKGAILKSTDGGVSWTSVTHTVGTIFFQDITAVDANNWYVVSNQGKVLFTSDGGPNIADTGANPEATIDWYCIDNYGANDIILGGKYIDGNGVIMSSADGGTTWVAETYAGADLYNYSARDIHMFSATDAIVVGDVGTTDGYVYILGNPGSGTGNVAPTANAGDDQIVDEAGPDLGATITLDGSGSSDSDGTITAWDWSWEGGTASGETADVELAAGTYTVTLTVTDDGGETATDEVSITVNVVVSVDGRMSPMTFALHANYPNPFNPSTQINYDLTESGIVDLTIYDVNGIEVSKLVQGYQSAGSHSLTFSANSLPSGVYVARLTSGMNTMTRKMILMK